MSKLNSATFPIFRDPPSVELLQWLARGSLKQNLLRAVRLWVWLRSLYDPGFGAELASLPDPFVYADWRDAFFSQSACHVPETAPDVHDRDCRCAKATAAWLFCPDLTKTQPEWEAFCQQAPSNPRDGFPGQRQFLQALQRHDAVPAKFEELLQVRLFGVTRRTLYEDLQILVKLQWVKRVGQQYYRCATLPARPLSALNEEDSAFLGTSNLNFLPPDLAAIACQHSQPINGIQRFFLHVDYIVPLRTLDNTDELSEQLRQLWLQTPVPPICLVYQSAKLGRRVTCVTYPICIYYVQRATYLCTFGEAPTQGEREVGGYNFRLDRIEQLSAKQWTDADIPPQLLEAYRKNRLPAPSDIEESLASAWGFDFYQPAKILLVRFERTFHDSYIQETVRHETFEKIPQSQARQLIVRATLKESDRQYLLKIVEAHPRDAYYQALFREGDPNVKIRLKGWRPNIEILLPWEVRQEIAADVEKEYKFYLGR